MFKKAMELDPKYSDAYASLGLVLWVDMFNQWSHDPHGLDRAIQLEQQGIALDNYNAYAYAVMSYLYASTKQYDLSITAVERALAFDPNSALGYGDLAFALVYSGKPAEALLAAHKAMRLNPRGELYAFIEGVAYTFMGRYEEAIPGLKRGAAGYPNNIPARLMLIPCYVELGQNEEARAVAAEVMRINPQFSLAVQKQISVLKEPLRDRFFADYAKAGLK
jgi:tetratricopeptide (TPR) repeat protein